MVNYSYLAYGSFTLGSLIYRKTGSSISLESAGSPRGEVYVEIEGKIVGPYRASSYPNSKSNTDNTPSANTINEGITEFNNKFGHDKGQKKGLNIVNENVERLAEGTTPNGEDVTIHPDDADAFF